MSKKYYDVSVSSDDVDEGETARASVEYSGKPHVAAWRAAAKFIKEQKGKQIKHLTIEVEYAGPQNPDDMPTIGEEPTPREGGYEERILPEEKATKNLKKLGLKKETTVGIVPKIEAIPDVPSIEDTKPKKRGKKKKEESAHRDPMSSIYDDL